MLLGEAGCSACVWGEAFVDLPPREGPNGQVGRLLSRGRNEEIETAA